MKLTIDEARYIELGIKYESDGNRATFTLPEQTGTIPVAIEGGELALFPERAAAHRRLIAALGVGP